jgi:hypothetical protein
VQLHLLHLKGVFCCIQSFVAPEEKVEKVIHDDG